MHPYILYTIHVKLTDVSNEVIRQKTLSGYSSCMYPYMHAHALGKINLPADVGIEVSRWGETWKG